MSRRRVQLIKRELYANLVRISSTRALYYVSTRLTPTLALHVRKIARNERVSFRMYKTPHRPYIPCFRLDTILDPTKLLSRYSETGEIVYTNR